MAGWMQSNMTPSNLAAPFVALPNQATIATRKLRRNAQISFALKWRVDGPNLVIGRQMHRLK